MAVPQHAATSSFQQPDLTGLPLLILNRAGYVALHTRLVGQGLEQVAVAVERLLRQAQSVRPYGGYYLPFDTLDDLQVFCRQNGISEPTLRLLYRSNILDYPTEERRASITVEPGYQGRVRAVRQLPTVQTT